MPKETDDILKKVNLDEGTILVDDKWLSKEDLSKVIKEKMEKGDYTIGNIAGALEELERVLAGSGELTARVPKDVFESYSTLGEKSGESARAWVRKGLMAYLKTEEPSNVLGVEPEVVAKKEEKVKEEPKKEKPKKEESKKEESKKEEPKEEEAKEEEEAGEAEEESWDAFVTPEEAEAEEKEPEAEEEEEGEEEEKEEEPKVLKKIKCRKCGSPIPITSAERPIIITCPDCGAKGKLVS